MTLEFDGIVAASRDIGSLIASTANAQGPANRSLPFTTHQNRQRAKNVLHADGFVLEID
jgi:hypothetical protein